jgi:hypothetical protein
MLDYGYRSACCLAAIKVGTKKIKKSTTKITVWVCCLCGTKDVKLISREEARQIREKDHLKPDIDDDNGFSE